jgi:DNA-binding Xre family transcriptional regulator
MSTAKKPASTLDRWLEKPAFKKSFEKEYKEFLLSELVHAIMAEDNKSVRSLAAELGISKTVIQNIRSGEQTDMKLSNFLKMTHAYGFQLVLEKGDQGIAL